MNSPIALEAAGQTWSYAALEALTAVAADGLRQQGVRVLATLLDNGPAWVLADRAAERAGVVHLPLPGFFSPAQMRHALQSAGADTLWIAPDGLPTRLPLLHTVGVPDANLNNPPTHTWQTEGAAPLSVTSLRLPFADQGLKCPAGTAKITFTSGSTGTPKGVCLSAAHQATVAAGIAEATAALGIRRHLCALPLPVLLENIAGVLAPLQQGICVLLPPLAEVGLHGSSQFDPARLDASVRQLAAESLILLPQQLRAWSGWLRQHRQRAPAALKLVAVGGAALGPGTLEAAWGVGIPACEGYGLSEGGSVQTLNLPTNARVGSVGRALPHARLRIAADGEIEIGGPLFLGYLSDPTPVPDWWPTGDLGALDSAGHLSVQGRKKQVLITGFGRNVSPEWVEAHLQDQPAIAHAVVLGEGQPALGAVLWPSPAAIKHSTPEAETAALDAAVQAANRCLPDYARIQRWVLGRGEFSARQGYATPNGRPLRDAIARDHSASLFADVPIPQPTLQGSPS